MARFNGRLENLVTYSTVFIILFSAHMLSAYEGNFVLKLCIFMEYY